MTNANESCRNTAVQSAAEHWADASAPRILVVTDDANMRQALLLCLSRARYGVIGCSSANDALAKAAGHSGDIHVLLTDIVLPLLDGIALYELLSSLRPDLRGIFTGTKTDLNPLALETLPGLYIEKPFSPALLLDKIDEIMRIDVQL